MNTCLESSKNSGCPPDVDKNLKGKDFCEQVLKKVKDIKQDKELFDAFKGIFSPLSNLKANSDNLQVVSNKLDIKISQSQIAEIDNQCKVGIYNNQSNIINMGNKECVKLFNESIENIKDENKKAELINNFYNQKTTIKNIDQKNANTIVSDCISSSTLDFISKNTSAVDNAAIQKIMADVKGLMAGSSVDQVTCNDISSTISACQYIQQKNCCSANFNSKQQNLVNIECKNSELIGITQSNDNASYQSCNLVTGSGMSSDIAASIINRTTQDATVKVAGLTMDFLIVFLIVAALIVLSPVVLIGSLGNKIFSMIGIIFIIVSLVMFGLYFTVGKEIVRTNDPEIVKNSKTDKNIYKNVSFKEAEKIAKDKSAIGFDFIVETKNADILDETIGTAILITETGKSDENEPEVGDVSIKTVIFAKKIYLYIGIGLLVGGILQLIFGYLKSEKGSKNKIAVK